MITSCRAVTAAACAVTAFAATLTAPSAHAEPAATTATVLRVVDGDTVDIVDDVRGRLRIRLLGIDTPETKKPGYSVGCWGPEASQFAISTLLGERVAFLTDASQGMYDRYGRTLAYLRKADGWDYSIEAARAGAAKSYVYHGKPVSESSAIAAAEQEATAAQRGLWGPPCYGSTASVPN
jgi:micrococcal nuclease